MNVNLIVVTLQNLVSKKVTILSVVRELLMRLRWIQLHNEALVSKGYKLCAGILENHLSRNCLLKQKFLGKLLLRIMKTEIWHSIQCRFKLSPLAS